MDLLVTSYGKQVLELASNLDQYGAAIGHVIDTRAADEFRSAVNHAANRVRTTRRLLGEVDAELRTLEAERIGFERGLDLIAMSDDPVTASYDRLMRRVEVHGLRIGRLTSDSKDLDLELKTLGADLKGNHTAAIEALEQCIARADEVAREREAVDQRREAARRKAVELESSVMWSPTAIAGYRAWGMGSDGMHGAWTRWRAPRMTASCSRGDGVPHAKGVCSNVGVGCGIYAAKYASDLIDSFGLYSIGLYAVGVVALEGRVVEHEKGYRASSARVVALVTADSNPLRLIVDPVDLATVFKDPGARGDLGTEIVFEGTNGVSFVRNITQHLKEHEPGGLEWT